VLDQVDLLLVMTVDPGFGGQAYTESMEGKVAEARRLIDRLEVDAAIEVDGGVSPATAPGPAGPEPSCSSPGPRSSAHPGGKRAAVEELRRSLQLLRRWSPRREGLPPRPVTDRDLDGLCVHTIRALAMDAVERARAGHPGMPVGAAPMAHVLWTRFLRHNPATQRGRTGTGSCSPPGTRRCSCTPCCI